MVFILIFFNSNFSKSIISIGISVDSLAWN